MPLPSNLPQVDAVLRMHFPYLPNKGAAAAAVTLYIIISVALTVVTVRTRLPYMMIVVLTALLELTGDYPAQQVINIIILHQAGALQHCWPYRVCTEPDNPLCGSMADTVHAQACAEVKLCGSHRQAHQ